MLLALFCKYPLQLLVILIACPLFQPALHLLTGNDRQPSAASSHGRRLSTVHREVEHPRLVDDDPLGQGTLRPVREHNATAHPRRLYHQRLRVGVMCQRQRERAGDGINHDPFLRAHAMLGGGMPASAWRATRRRSAYSSAWRRTWHSRWSGWHLSPRASRASSSSVAIYRHTNRVARAEEPVDATTPPE